MKTSMRRVGWCGGIFGLLALAAGACGSGSKTSADAGAVVDGGSVIDGGAVVPDGGTAVDGAVTTTCPTPGQVMVAGAVTDGGIFARNIESLAVDSTHVYATVRSSGQSQDTLAAVTLNGGAQTSLVSGGSFMFRIATDGVFAYFNDQRSGAPALQRVPVGGGTREAYTSPASGDAFVLDGTNLVAMSSGSMTGITFNQDGKVWTQPAGTLNPTITPVFSTGTKIMGVAAGGGFIDWIDQGSGANTGTVNQVASGGGTVTMLAMGQNAPVAIAVGGGKVFWLTIDHVLHAVAQTGGAASVLTSSASTASAVSLQALATDGTSVYFRGNTNTAVVMKVPVGGGAVTVVGCNATWAAAPANPIAIDSSFVYWPDGLTIWKAPK